MCIACKTEIPSADYVPWKSHVIFHFQASTSLRSPVVAVHGADIIGGIVKKIGFWIAVEMVRSCSESPGGST